MSNAFNARKLLKLFGLFLLFYAASLALWLWLKGPYQNVVNTVCFKAAGWTYDVKLLDTHLQDDGTTVMTATNRYVSLDLGGKDRKVVFDILLDIDAITFNVPMTLALLLSIVIVLEGKRKKEEIFNGMMLLVMLHFVTMYVVSISLILSTAEQSKDLRFYLQGAWMPKELLLNIGSLLSHYAARFEPFLIAVFVWWRMNK